MRCISGDVSVPSKIVGLLRGLALKVVLPVAAHQHADIFIGVGVDEAHQVRGAGPSCPARAAGTRMHGHEKEKPQPTLAHNGRILARHGREGYGF